jgi:two-component system CheB/CheR fusion protein
MDNDFFVVGIGASVGGESALYDFFANIPNDLNAAFIVVRHQKRDYQSQMKFLLSRHTRFPIYTIRHGEEVKPGAIYLIPENNTATIKSGHLFLQQRAVDTHADFTIDEFLMSLAEDMKTRAIGIILSGISTDGTNGANAIEEHGGLIMVQEPKSAKLDSMANSVIANDFPDYILPARKMGTHLKEYITAKQRRQQLR